MSHCDNSSSTDTRFAANGFCPPNWPAGTSFEAYLVSLKTLRREEISPYQ